MKQIRRGVFETNSSSVHSITMCMKPDFDKWKNGEVYLNDGWWSNNSSEYAKKQFVTREEAIDIILNAKYYSYLESEFNSMDSDEFEECLRENEIYTRENYGGDYYEGFSDTFTTPNGEEVVAFGYYGNDY